jgi:aminoglycoside phosphotransferase (APT) family kinase protein
MVLDQPGVARLTALDPVFGRLPAALEGLSADATWRLHDVRWTPGERCALAFATDGRFVAVELTQERWVVRDFREDTALPGVATATDPEAVGARLPGPAGAGWHPAPVRYRPGSRCVVRLDGDGRTVYAKALRRGGASAPWVSAARAMTDAAGGVPVVPVVDVWADVDVVVTAALDGRPASAVLGDQGLGALGARRLGAGMGRLLAQLHEQPATAVPGRDAEDRLRELAGLLDCVRVVEPALAARMGRVVSALADRPPTGGRVVLGHGGFRPGQIVVAPGGALAVLDLDGLCRCDPARDLASALAHLSWHAATRPGRHRVAAAAAGSLVSAYEERVGRVDPETLRWWRAAALLQVAARRFRRLEVADWPRVPALVAAAERALEPAGRPAVRRDRPRARRAASVADVLQAALGARAAGPLELDEPAMARATPKRSVTRVAVRGLDGPEAASVMVKVFAEPRRAELLHEHLELLWTGPFSGGPLRVPEPLGLAAEHAAVVFRAFDGVPLDTVADRDRGVAGVHGAARWLARLHRADVALPRRQDLAQEAVSTAEWATVVGEHHPDLLPAAQTIARDWHAGLAVRAAVPIHKDFHAGHVLLGEGTCVIDHDEARLGDPAFDVAHFCAYLELSPGGPRGALLQQVFLGEYRAAGGRAAAPGELAPFAAYTWLKIAKQWAVGSGPGRNADDARRRLGVVEALGRGRACLAP